MLFEGRAHTVCNCTTSGSFSKYAVNDSASSWHVRCRLAQHQQQQEQQRRLVGSQGQLLAASQGGNLSVSELERQLLLQQHREQAAAAQGLYGAQVCAFLRAIAT